jgi:hypothetical protein
MSQLIRSDVAAETRFAVVEATLRRARDQGGWVAEEAERFLADVHTLATTNTADRVAADDALTRAREQLPFAERTAHLVVGRIHDALWNDLGRPAADPRFVVLFPAGTRTGTMGARDGHPAALRALASRLETVGHKRLAKDRLTAAAAEIRETATALATAIDRVDAAAEVAGHHHQLEQALARVAYLQLSALKRILLANGLRGPEVDAVLPPTKHPRRRSPAAVPVPVPVPVPDATPAAEGTSAATSGAVPLERIVG